MQKRLEIEKIKSMDFGALKPSKTKFTAHLKGKHNIIAEIKRRSPAGGMLSGNLDLEKAAIAYDKYANAVSVVTDNKFFGGDNNDIAGVRKHTALPVLRKDFIISEIQVLESRHYGANAVLLLASILSAQQIGSFISCAKKYNMQCVVEVHTEQEVAKALSANAEIIGINNRSMNDMSIDINTTVNLLPMIPKGKLVISESGFGRLEQINSVDVNAVLVGTSLIKSKSISSKLASLRKPKVKVCGITSLNDALAAAKLGADFLGFNFYRKSPRHITPEKAHDILKSLDNNIATVGIFVNEEINAVKKAAEISGVDYLQFHGDESPSYCSMFSLPVIKAFRVCGKMPDTSGYNVFAFLFDAFEVGRYGGTGKAFDVSIIKNIPGKVFIAGGLSLGNIAGIIAHSDPYCFDVCTGVEEVVGIKNIGKMAEFIKVVKNAR